MYIYNVTIKIDKSIEDEWLAWMNTEHIQEVIGTGLFHDYSFMELLEPHDDDGRTFVVQYYTNSLDACNEYLSQHAMALRDKGIEKFGQQFVAFRTLLKKHIS